MICLERVVNENIHLKKQIRCVSEDLAYIFECVDHMYECAQDDEQDKLLLELGKLYGYIKSLNLEVFDSCECNEEDSES